MHAIEHLSPTAAASRLASLVLATGLALAVRPGPAAAVTPGVPSARAAAFDTGAVAPASRQPILRSIADAVSADSLRAVLTRLVSFGTRNTLSDTVSDTRGIGAARRWIKGRMDTLSERCGGCLQVFFQRNLVPPGRRVPDTTAVVNVVAVQRGTTDPGRYVLITGHYDSRVSDVLNDTSFAPGADDDGSGVAAVLEAARVLSRHKFAATVVYAALAGEEQGLFGGKGLAAYAREHGWRIEADLNNDIIGNIEGIDGIIDNTTARVFSEGTRATESARTARIRRYTGGEVDSPSREVARYVARMSNYVRNLHVMLIYRLDRFGRGGDHSAFNDVGYPAVRITERNENYHRQHQDVRVEDGIHYGDVLAGVNFPYLRKMAALNLVSLASMAWAPAPPEGVQIRGAVRPSTTLKWDASDASRAPDLAGYRIYWRPTDAARWQKSVWVGGATQHTLEDVVIDNYTFGVAAVSKDGFESPAVFPGPVGDFAPPPDSTGAGRGGR
ncbi:MAG: M28 family metallopeptidase [Candidatus Palauibacterales bacterium]|nr:M28 family metallopeptidase [Candidatus Palauibacterales bacterium]MDP2529772.1 M28 family metallopeptidase [Candidatus Palauibacterales bacterium]MDP2585127.1 M28 family metallopeptidase [Candidatus Palauibacterales bacterium]